VTARQEPTLAAVWAASVAQARASLAAVERGELRASERQQTGWRDTIAKAKAWGQA